MKVIKIDQNEDAKIYASHICVLSIFLFITIISWSQVKQLADTSGKEKTTFQTRSKWIPEINPRSDVAIIYGADDMANVCFGERVKSWRDRGHKTAFVTGIAGEFTSIISWEMGWLATF